jgi:hypothetical protein
MSRAHVAPPLQGRRTALNLWLGCAPDDALHASRHALPSRQSPNQRRRRCRVAGAGGDLKVQWHESPLNCDVGPGDATSMCCGTAHSEWQASIAFQVRPSAALVSKGKRAQPASSIARWSTRRPADASSAVTMDDAGSEAPAFPNLPSPAAPVARTLGPLAAKDEASNRNMPTPTAVVAAARITAASFITGLILAATRHYTR